MKPGPKPRSVEERIAAFTQDGLWTGPIHQHRPSLQIKGVKTHPVRYLLRITDPKTRMRQTCFCGPMCVRPEHYEPVAQHDWLYDRPSITPEVTGDDAFSTFHTNLYATTPPNPGMHISELPEHPLLREALEFDGFTINEEGYLCL